MTADMTADHELHTRVMARFGDIFAPLADAAGPPVHPDVLVETVVGATMFRLLVRPDAPVGAEWLAEMTSLLVKGLAAQPAAVTHSV